MVNDQVRSMPLSKSDCLTEKAWPLFSLNQKYLKTVAQAEGFDIHPPDCPHRPQVAPTLPPRSCSQPQRRPHAVPPPPRPPTRPCTQLHRRLHGAASLHATPTQPPRRPHTASTPGRPPAAGGLEKRGGDLEKKWEEFENVCGGGAWRYFAPTHT